MSQNNNEQITPTTENNTAAADVVDQQVQESSDQGSWGSWWSSTIGNVVRVMNHQTNQFGQQLQKLVEEGDESTTPTTPTTTTNEEKVEEENGEINDNGGEANTSSLIEQTEKTIETSFKSAESTIKSFFSTISGVTSTVYAETSQLVDETVELKFVKGLATQFGKTVLNTLEEASKILYDAEESDDGIHIYVNFKELFIEYEGLKHLQEIAALAKNCNQELEKYMEERTDQERETIEKILRELREIMIESTQFSTKEVEEKKSIYQYIANLPVGKEVIEMTNSSVELSKNAYNNLEDVLASTTEVSEMLQTSTILLEKSKAECYRSLAKLASLASNHILILSKHLLDPSNSGILPIQWKDTNSNSKDAKHVATLLRDYLLFLYSQLIEISNQYTEALKKNTQIVGIKLDEQQREKLEVRAMKMASRLHIHSDKALSIIISCDKEFLDILQYLASVWIQ